MSASKRGILFLIYCYIVVITRIEIRLITLIHASGNIKIGSYILCIVHKIVFQKPKRPNLLPVLHTLGLDFGTNIFVQWVLLMGLDQCLFLNVLLINYWSCMKFLFNAFHCFFIYNIIFRLLFTEILFAYYYSRVQHENK